MSDVKFNTNKLPQDAAPKDCAYFFKYMKLDEVNDSQFKQLEEILSSDTLPICANDHKFNQWVILKQILTHKMIYLGRYAYLNDPFECVANIDYSNGVDDEIISKYHAIAAPRIAEIEPQYQLTLLQIKEKISRHKIETIDHLYHPACFGNPLPFGVYSLCEDPDNIQMWSYYGGSHSGVCIAFKVDWAAIISRLKARHPDASLATIKNILINRGFRFDFTDNDGEIIRFGFQKVCYSPGVVSYPANQFMMAYYEQPLADDFSWVLTSNKAIGWNHEAEWRLTSFNRYSESSSDLLPLSVFDFLKPCGIILGASMKQGIKNMVKKFYGESYPIFELAPAINNGVLNYSLAPNKAYIIAALDVSIISNHQDIDIESMVESNV